MSKRVPIERVGAHVVRELLALASSRSLAASGLSVRGAVVTLPFRDPGSAEPRPVAIGDAGRPVDAAGAVSRLAALGLAVEVEADGLAAAPPGRVASLTMHVEVSGIRDQGSGSQRTRPGPSRGARDVP